MKKILFVFSPVFLLFLSATPLLLAAAPRTITIHSEAHINDILELTVSSAGTGESEIRFGSIPSSSTPTEIGPIIIVVSVVSNTGQRYQVTQFLNGPLKNANGDEIAPENLKFITSSAKSTGTPVTTSTPASSSLQTIFTSDATGTSDKISAQYMLTPPAFQAPGDYSAFLTYTASAL